MTASGPARTTSQDCKVGRTRKGAKIDRYRHFTRWLIRQLIKEDRWTESFKTVFEDCRVVLPQERKNTTGRYIKRPVEE
jgi:hypothetical protein